MFETVSFDFGNAIITPQICSQYYEFEAFELSLEEGLVPEDLGLSISTSGLLQINTDDIELKDSQHQINITAWLNNPY